MNRTEKEDWFYTHDNEWQNDIEEDFYNDLEFEGDLIDFAFNRYKKVDVSEEDVRRISGDVELTEEDIIYIQREIDRMPEEDPSGDWILWVEHLIWELKD